MNGKIPRKLALKLCEQIRKENERKKFGVGKIKCSMCYKVARDDISKLCILANEMNGGCSQVNKRYEKLYGR